MLSLLPYCLLLVSLIGGIRVIPLYSFYLLILKDFFTIRAIIRADSYYIQRLTTHRRAATGLDAYVGRLANRKP